MTIMPPKGTQPGSIHILSTEGHLSADPRIEFSATWNGAMWKSEGCAAISPEKAARCGFEYVRAAKHQPQETKLCRATI
jgi:hypothetical protein